MATSRIDDPIGYVMADAILYPTVVGDEAVDDSASAGLAAAYRVGRQDQAGSQGLVRLTTFRSGDTARATRQLPASQAPIEPTGSAAASCSP